MRKQVLEILRAAAPSVDFESSVALADDGIIDSAQDSINATLKKLTKQYLSVSASIDDTVARYTAQFTQLDTMMSKLNNTSTYLSQQFTAMSNS